MIHIGGKVYEIIYENKNGWNPDAFRDRYSEVLDRYDYIVGDWGYNQLRLKGFLKDNHAKATKDCSFSSLSDYINEYCNFGCAYFVLEKVGFTRQAEDGTEPEEEAPEASAERAAAADKPEQPNERPLRYSRTEPDGRPERKGAGDAAGRLDVPEKAGKPYPKHDKLDRPDKPERQADRPDRSDRGARFDRPDKTERPERSRYPQRDRKPRSQHYPEQVGEGETNSQRKNNRPNGHHRNKKPFGITAKDDVAAASEDNRRPRKDPNRT